MKQIVKAGWLALLLGSAVALPVQEAGAVTRCREVIRHGEVVSRTCTTWRHGYDHRRYYYGYPGYYRRHWDRGYYHRRHWDRGYRDW
jgi:hypothetical protein